MKYNKPILMLISGVAGCGKTTFIKDLLSVDKENTYKIVSPDELRKELCGNISDQSRNREVWDIAKTYTIDFLNDKENVIIDSTMCKEKYLKSFVKYVKPMIHVDFDIYWHVIRSYDANQACEAIQKDIKNGVDRSNVPLASIEKMFNNLNELLKNSERVKKELNIKDENFSIAQIK